jgi:hypothetical protein
VSRAKPTNPSSKVAERLEWLIGKSVSVRVAYAEIGQMGGEVFQATYVDIVPLGREYFFVFNVGGLRRVFRTSSVIELQELPAP